MRYGLRIRSDSGKAEVFLPASACDCWEAARRAQAAIRDAGLIWAPDTEIAQHMDTRRNCYRTILTVNPT